MNALYGIDPCPISPNFFDSACPAQPSIPGLAFDESENVAYACMKYRTSPSAQEGKLPSGANLFFIREALTHETARTGLCLYRARATI